MVDFSKIKEKVKKTAGQVGNRFKEGATNIGFHTNMAIQQRIEEERAIRRDISKAKAEETRKQRIQQAISGVREKYKKPKTTGFNVDFFGENKTKKKDRKREIKYF